jgi:threonine dehydratase
LATRRIPLTAIQDAASSIYDVVRRTPLVPLDIPHPVPPALAGCSLYVKLELLQPNGSFKIRGAWNAVRQIPREELRDGIWTVSAGNAAQGVALAAKRAGVPCSVMVMDTAPRTKIAAIERLGASIVSAPYDECWRTVEAHGSPRMRGRFIHPFDDDRFIAGNATVALEILEDLPDTDAIVAPLGGGGLVAGIGSATRELRPATRIYAAEPETAAPFATSLRNGRPSAFDGWQSSFVDGAGGRSVLPTMWGLLSEVVTGAIVVSLAEVAAAMKLAAERCHVIAEGAAGCAVAAALSGKIDRTDGRPLNIVAVISGGNIDLSKFASLVGACDQ